MKKEKYRKCSKNGFCKTMREKSSVYPGQKGIRIHHITYLPTMKLAYAFAAYHISAKDIGLALNFCPWCGGNIQNWDKK